MWVDFSAPGTPRCTSKAATTLRDATLPARAGLPPAPIDLKARRPARAQLGNPLAVLALLLLSNHRYPRCPSKANPAGTQTLCNGAWTAAASRLAALAAAAAAAAARSLARWARRRCSSSSVSAALLRRRAARRSAGNHETEAPCVARPRPEAHWAFAANPAHLIPPTSSLQHPLPHAHTLSLARTTHARKTSRLHAAGNLRPAQPGATVPLALAPPPPPPSPVCGLEAAIGIWASGTPVPSPPAAGDAAESGCTQYKNLGRPQSRSAAHPYSLLRAPTKNFRRPSCARHPVSPAVTWIRRPARVRPGFAAQH